MPCVLSSWIFWELFCGRKPSCCLKSNFIYMRKTYSAAFGWNIHICILGSFCNNVQLTFFLQFYSLFEVMHVRHLEWYNIWNYYHIAVYLFFSLFIYIVGCFLTLVHLQHYLYYFFRWIGIFHIMKFLSLMIIGSLSLFCMIKL